jgi:hypothetical protein
LKNITFHINNSAYTIDIGEDINNKLEQGLKKFLTTEQNLTTQSLLLAYLQKTQELVEFEDKLQNIIDSSILSVDNLRK